MNRGEVRDRILDGIRRMHWDGVEEWSRENIQRAIRQEGIRDSLDDPEIQSLLRELEAEGLIRVYRHDDLYLRLVRTS